MDSLSLRASVKPVFFIMALLGIVRSSETDSSCPCPAIPSLKDTQPPIQGCYQIKSTFRYKCKDGYVRKAGTSNMIRCISNSEWTKAMLTCIPNPLAPPQLTTKTTSTTTSVTVTPRVNFMSSASADTGHIELTSTGLTPQHTPDPPTSPTSSAPVSPDISHSTSSPQSLSKDPPTNTTSSAPVSSDSSHSTSSTQSHTKEPRRLFWTTSPSSLSSFNNSTFQGKDTAVTNMIAGVVVGAILLVAAGLGYFLYRWRSRNNIEQGTTEEIMPMRNTHSN